MPLNSVVGLADGKPWVSMPLSQSGFTMPSDITFLVLVLSTNVSVMLVTRWLLALYVQSMLCIMANHTIMASEQLSARIS